MLSVYFFLWMISNIGHVYLMKLYFINTSGTTSFAVFDVTIVRLIGGAILGSVVRYAQLWFVGNSKKLKVDGEARLSKHRITSGERFAANWLIGFLAFTTYLTSIGSVYLLHASISQTFRGLEPLVGALFSWMFYGDRFPPSLLVFTFTIFAGMYLLSERPSPHHADIATSNSVLLVGVALSLTATFASVLRSVVLEHIKYSMKYSVSAEDTLLYASLWLIAPLSYRCIGYLFKDDVDDPSVAQSNFHSETVLILWGIAMSQLFIVKVIYGFLELADTRVTALANFMVKVVSGSLLVVLFHEPFNLKNIVGFCVVFVSGLGANTKKFSAVNQDMIQTPRGDVDHTVSGRLLQRIVQQTIKLSPYVLVLATLTISTILLSLQLSYTNAQVSVTNSVQKGDRMAGLHVLEQHDANPALHERVFQAPPRYARNSIVGPSIRHVNGKFHRNQPSNECPVHNGRNPTILLLPVTWPTMVPIAASMVEANFRVVTVLQPQSLEVSNLFTEVLDDPDNDVFYCTKTNKLCLISAIWKYRPDIIVAVEDKLLRELFATQEFLSSPVTPHNLRVYLPNFNEQRLKDGLSSIEDMLDDLREFHKLKAFVVEANQVLTNSTPYPGYRKPLLVKDDIIYGIVNGVLGLPIASRIELAGLRAAISILRCLEPIQNEHEQFCSGLMHSEDPKHEPVREAVTQLKRFPIILKGSYGVSGSSVRIANSLQEVIDAYQQLKEGNVVGSVYKGSDNGHLRMHAERFFGSSPPFAINFVSYRGTLLHANALKKAETVGATGASTVNELKNEPKAVEVMRKLVKELGYSGFGASDFVVDDQGNPRLIDMNPRPTPGTVLPRELFPEGINLFDKLRRILCLHPVERGIQLAYPYQYLPPVRTPRLVQSHTIAKWRRAKMLPDYAFAANGEGNHVDPGLPIFMWKNKRFMDGVSRTHSSLIFDAKNYRISHKNQPEKYFTDHIAKYLDSGNVNDIERLLKPVD